MINLQGKWDFAPASASVAIDKIAPAGLRFEDSVEFPGTLDENGKGVENTDRSNRAHFSRERHFEGIALYSREITVPEAWREKRVVLKLERTRKTTAWLDGRLLGSNSRSTTPHEYDLGTCMEPGPHRLTVAVDNRREGWPPGNSHMATEDTQSNWNGIVGAIKLESTPLVWIRRVRFTPDVRRQNVRVSLDLGNLTGAFQKGTVTIGVTNGNPATGAAPLDPFTAPFECAANSGETNLVLALGCHPLLWDEFSPGFYHAKIALQCAGQSHEIESTFGLRDFRRSGTQFAVNGRTIFLRGKHDACVFPLTGYAPMDVQAWTRVFTIAKEYGINAYRFHTWCPPEEAFEAADLVGIYLQPELPGWGALAAAEKQITVDDPNAVAFGTENKTALRVYDPAIPTDAEIFLTDEGKAIIDQFGNHPSFCMFALGNEMSGSRVVMQRMVDTLRDYDGARRLFAQGSNNGFRDPKPGLTDDFFTTVRTSKSTWDNLDNTVRASFAFVDQKEGGSINSQLPATTRNYSKALCGIAVPVIGHETGQYQYYPDFRELTRYTGVMKPWNLEAARKLLEEQGMLDQADEFFRAAGVFASILYGQDIESEIRTPGFGGFHLLDLQDYPGQDTALVGPLNSFMESKGVITPEKWRQSCDRVVLLAEFPDYVLTGETEFSAAIKVANYGPASIERETVEWSLGDIAEGRLANAHLPQGALSEAGQIQCRIPLIDKPRSVVLSLSLQGIRKEYPLWIFPRQIEVAVPPSVTICGKLDSTTESILAGGGHVILIPEHDAVKEWSLPGLFPTEFWSYTMFSKIALGHKIEPGAGTMGLLINNRHPALAGFPTEFHSNWQWWSIVRHSRPLILDDAPKGYRPIVQTIDNLWRSHKLSTLCEFKVGKGSLLVSAIDFRAIQNRPEGRALWASVLAYAASTDFKPTVELAPESSLGKRLRFGL